MRPRIVAILMIVVASAATALAYHRRDAAAMTLVEGETERIAVMLSKQDREAILTDRLLREHPAAAEMLLRHGPALSAGYRVAAIRNGERGRTLLSMDDVTHVGIIEMPAGSVQLGFRLDRESKELVFVTSSFSSMIRE